MIPSPFLPCLIVMSGVLLAQSPQPGGALEPAQPAANDLRVPVHTHANEPSYGTWAAGDAYKASFDGGMTFYPMLGRDYPQNQPLRWRTTSVRIGEQELLGAGGETRMSHGEYRVEYAHGAVIEAYDVRNEGLEQTFVIAQRPAANGELCITGAIGSDLFAPNTAPAVTDLVFHDEGGTPLVRYGRATAIDADGDAFAMTTACDDGVITLRLAAADVARADFPLVVDPLVGVVAEFFIGSATEVGDVSAASFGGGSINSVIGYTRHFSATDTDVVLLLGNAALGQMVPVFSDVAAAASASHIRASFVTATSRWIAVYENLIHSSQAMQLRTLMFDPAQVGTPLSYPHIVVPGTHEWRPDVGGTAAGSSTQALVVYQQETGTTTFANTPTSRVMGMLVDTAGNIPTWSSPFHIFGATTEDAERPSVNRYAEGGSAFSWFVVAQTYNNAISGDDWDIAGRLVNNAGAASGAWSSSLATAHKLGPVVDGRNGRFCVVFSTSNLSVGKTQDVLGTALCAERVDMPHGALTQDLAGDWPVQTLATNQFRLLEATTNAHDPLSRSHWQLGWRSSSTVPAIYTNRVGYRGAPLYAPDLIATTGSTVPGPVSAIFNAQNRASAVAFMVRNNSGVCTLMRSILILPSPIGWTNNFGCSPGVTRWYGPSNRMEENESIGGDLSGVETISTPSGSLHLLVVGTTSTNLPVVHPVVGANCILQVPTSGPNYLGIMPLGIGSTVRWSLPLPESMSTMDLYFQDWVYDSYTNTLRNTGMLQINVAK